MSVEAKTLHQVKSWGGTLGEIIISINVGSSKFDLDDMDRASKEKLQHAAYKAHDIINSAVEEVILSNDPDFMESAKNEREKLLALFPHQIWAEPVRNEYDGDSARGKLRPWFRVTTTIGVFTIGWRKRVINIDWSRVDTSPKAEVLFPSEAVTKGEYYIHAYGYEKAAEYIKTIYASVERGDHV